MTSVCTLQTEVMLLLQSATTLVLYRKLDASWGGCMYHMQ